MIPKNTEFKEAQVRAMTRLAQLTVALVPLAPGAAFLVGNAWFPVGAFAVLMAAVALFGTMTGGRHGRVLIGLGLTGQAMAFSAALTGHPWQIDSHMLYFALLAVAMSLSDGRVILTSAAAIAVQHVVLTVAMPGLIYPSVDLVENLARTGVHGTIVALEAAVLYLLIRERQRLDTHMAEATEASARAAEREQKMQREAVRVQEQVVRQLGDALTRLARRDLSVSIQTAFDPAHDSLRQNFNEAIAELRGTVKQVIRNARSVSEDADLDRHCLGSRWPTGRNAKPIPCRKPRTPSRRSTRMSAPLPRPHAAPPAWQRKHARARRFRIRWCSARSTPWRPSKPLRRRSTRSSR